MILPLKATVLHSMEPNDGDSAIVTQVKAAIRENLEDRYSSCQDFLHKCTALDPRFKSLPHVDDVCCDRIYNSLSTEIVAIEEEHEEAKGTAAAASPSHTEHPEASESPPPVKRSAMTELFGELFQTEVGDKKNTLQQVKKEVAAYKAVSSISLDSDPLLWWKKKESTYPLIAKLA
ncbi:E3 SUMO-protein ligase ZBED1-like [Engraulis encrasicolus]|uniref:E3 SUMO-protein ligase ZBED1-like n=1 Tax=Engraulis encrasicolus TaxID=184585 RepID=UPI002FD03516